jgi:hypothetical protein
MSHAFLVIIVLLPVLDWIATAVLVMLANRTPHIGALTERAFAAGVVSVTTTIYAIVAINSETGWALWDVDGGRVIIRILFIAIGAAPIAFLALYWHRRR